ncbi:McrB family protein [Pyrococcus horikoshii]|nr:McrB family protein [Pyrococcus horikoshii]
MNTERIIEIVKEMKKYSIEFEKVIEKVEEFRRRVEEAWKKDKKDVIRYLGEFERYISGNELSKVLYLKHDNRRLIEYLGDEDFRGLLEEVSKITDYEEFSRRKGNIARYLENIKKKKNEKKLIDLGPAIITSWMTIFNPKMFMPLGNWLNPILEELSLEKNWGFGGWDSNKIIRVYEELNEENFRKELEEQGIKTLLEVAYYLKKYIDKGENEYEINNLKPKNELKNDLRSYLEASGYKYSQSQISQFYVALKTKGFVILSGLTGSGKTKIAQELGELLDLPQVMSASGPNTVAKREIKSLQETINRHGFAVYGWHPPGKISKIKPPFIFWVYDSDENDEYYKKVPYGIVVRDVIVGKNIPEEWRKGIEWAKEVYGYDIERYINEHDVFLKVVEVIPCGLEISEFIDVEEGRNLTTKDAQRIRSGFIYVKAPEECRKWSRPYIFLSVRPDWRDSKLLLGYYNPITGKYNKTKLLDFIMQAIEDYKNNGENALPYIIILDEMNLAHVEYYFADFLSVLESGRDEKGFTRESIKLHDVDEVEEKQGVPKEIKLPPNLYIVGTVNIDETTYMFSPKVLDRAFVIEFHEVDLENYPPREEKLDEDHVVALRNLILEDLRRDGKFLNYSKHEINEAVRELDLSKVRILNEVLEPYDLHFGYRVVDEIALFLKNAKESREKGIVSFENEDEIFDLALLMKVLPKFHGNRRKLEKPLLLVLKFAKTGEIREEDAEKGEEELWKEIFGASEVGDTKAVIKEMKRVKDYKYKHTGKKALRMLRQLYEVGFASFS